MTFASRRARQLKRALFSNAATGMASITALLGIASAFAGFIKEMLG